MLLEVAQIPRFRATRDAAKSAAFVRRFVPDTRGYRLAKIREARVGACPPRRRLIKLPFTREVK